MRSQWRLSSIIPLTDFEHPFRWQYHLAATYDPELIDNFEASSCLQSREFRNSVIFHGALHGNDKCRINRRHAVEDGDLYDIYEAFVGYDDLYSYVDDQ